MSVVRVWRVSVAWLYILWHITWMTSSWSPHPVSSQGMSWQPPMIWEHILLCDRAGTRNHQATWSKQVQIHNASHTRGDRGYSCHGDKTGAMADIIQVSSVRLTWQQDGRSQCRVVHISSLYLTRVWLLNREEWWRLVGVWGRGRGWWWGRLVW